MRLIILYGPPAVGKLTVAKCLSKKTGIKIFHNHVSIDLVNEYLEKSENRDKLVTHIRKLIFEEAAKQNIDLIFTFVYASKIDDDYIDKLIEPILQNNGTVYFVQLICDKNELIKRVEDDSRKQFSKIQSKKVLKKVLGENKLFELMTNKTSLTINNTNLSAEEVSSKIINYFTLI